MEQQNVITEQHLWHDNGSQFYRSNKSNYEYGSIEKVVCLSKQILTAIMSTSTSFSETKTYMSYSFKHFIVFSLAVVASKILYQFAMMNMFVQKKTKWMHTDLCKNLTLQTIDLNFKLILALWNHTEDSLSPSLNMMEKNIMYTCFIESE